MRSRCLDASAAPHRFSLHTTMHASSCSFNLMCVQDSWFSRKSHCSLIKGMYPGEVKGASTSLKRNRMFKDACVNGTNGEHPHV